MYIASNVGVVNLLWSGPEILFLMRHWWGKKIIWAEHDICKIGITSIKEHEVPEMRETCLFVPPALYQVIKWCSNIAARVFGISMGSWIPHFAPLHQFACAWTTACCIFSLFSACSHGTYCFVAWCNSCVCMCGAQMIKCNSACFVKSPLPLHGKKYIGLAPSTLLYNDVLWDEINRSGQCCYAVLLVSITEPC